MVEIPVATRNAVTSNCELGQGDALNTMWASVALAAIAAAWLARSNYVRIQALREQQRLASFPSSNPHPVS